MNLDPQRRYATDDDLRYDDRRDVDSDVDYNAYPGEDRARSDRDPHEQSYERAREHSHEHSREAAYDVRGEVVTDRRLASRPRRRVKTNLTATADVSYTPVPRSDVSFNRLRPLVPAEPMWHRLLFLGLTLVFTAAYFVALYLVTAPAHLGIDQNGYLVGGRLLAEQGDMALHLTNPFQFVGGMFVGVDDPATGAIAYWPKYPAGLPLLYAACFWIMPTDAGAVWLAHYVSPIAAALSVLGMFFLGRFAGGSFLGLLAAIALAGSQMLLGLGTNPNSHAAALCFVVWGFVALLAWWRSGRMLFGIAAGLCIGYAFTIRYTEGLLGLPLGIACLSAWTARRPVISGLRVIVPIVAWGVPVAGLLAWNKWKMGLWTGYGATSESAGLSFKTFFQIEERSGAFNLGNFLDNWQTMAEQLNDGGLFFLVPIGVLGVLALLARRFQLGLVMLAWLLGTVGIYTAYYWAPDTSWEFAYLRFFLTVLPVMLFGVSYGLWRVLQAPTAGQASLRSDTKLWRSIMQPVVAGLIVAIAVGMGTYRAVGIVPTVQASSVDGAPGLQAHYQNNNKYAVLSNLLREASQPGDIVLVNSPGNNIIANLLHHFQFALQADTYDVSMFSDRYARRVRNMGRMVGGDGEADVFDPTRHAELLALYEGKTQDDLDGELESVITRALDGGHDAWLVMTDVDYQMFTRRQLGELPGLTVDERRLMRWKDQPLIRDGSEREPRQTTGGLGFRQFLGAELAVQRSWVLVPIIREAPREALQEAPNDAPAAKPEPATQENAQPESRPSSSLAPSTAPSTKPTTTPSDRRAVI